MWDELFWQKYELFTLSTEILALKRKFEFLLERKKQTNKQAKTIGFLSGKKILGVNHG